ncbi:MAG TPA: pilus assembly protein TadG-related protein [Terracidiphilus sp.]|nr:pilus assembly protein TadG-related protein [Terracidiphilus sp.]
MLRRGIQFILKQRNALESESGQVVVLTLLCLTVLLGFMGLALDVGLLFRARRNAQIAADAAATAAALDYHYNTSVSSAQAAGRAASAANGITNGSNGDVVTVNMPPANGPNTAYTSFAEAIVVQPNPTLFMGLFGFGKVNVAARAVAGNPAAAKGCMYITNESASGALKLQGKSSIGGGNGKPSCGIVVASTSPSAVDITGGASVINASYVAIAGGLSGSTQKWDAPVQQNVAGLVTDPLADEVSKLPDGATACDGSNTSGATTITQSTIAGLPQSTVNGFAVTCFSKDVTFSGTVNLLGSSDGVLYIFKGNVTIGVGAKVQFGDGQYDSSTNTFSNTSGATMELYSGTLTQKSNSLLSIYAPAKTTSNANAIAILQPASNTNDLEVQFGSNNQVLDGFIYAPGAAVTLHDNGGGVTATGVVANTMFLKASSLTLPNYSSANLATTPLTQILLVE